MTESLGSLGLFVKLEARGQAFGSHPAPRYQSRLPCRSSLAKLPKGEKGHEHLQAALCHRDGRFRGGITDQSVGNGAVPREAEREPHHRGRRPSRDRGATVWSLVFHFQYFLKKDLFGFRTRDGGFPSAILLIPARAMNRIMPRLYFIFGNRPQQFMCHF